MNDNHAQLVSELRVLVDSVFDRIEPVLRSAAHPHEADESTTEEDSREASPGCSWCPVCAVVALVRGEQHDLVALVAGQLSALIALLRELLDEYWPSRQTESDPEGPGAPPAGTHESPAGYVPITVTIKS